MFFILYVEEEPYRRVLLLCLISIYLATIFVWMPDWWVHGCLSVFWWFSWNSLVVSVSQLKDVLMCVRTKSPFEVVLMLKISIADPSISDWGVVDWLIVKVQCSVVSISLYTL